MKRFTRLFVQLDETNKTAEKVAAMEQYFRDAAPADAAWGLFFLSGQRLKRVVKTAIIKQAALDATGFPEWVLGESYEAVGDLSETITLLLPEHGIECDEALHEVVLRRIMPLVSEDGRAARTMLLDAWKQMDRNQCFVFNKLIRGNFRVGVQAPLVVRALSQATDVDAAVLLHRLSGHFEPTAKSFEALCAKGSTASDAARPYPFCLAHQLERPAQALGLVQRWMVEYKWDGIRAQVLRRDGLADKVAIWSRGEELITRQFPEIAEAARHLPAGTVLDGEILAWRVGADGESGRPLSFNALQTRLNRKNVQPSLFDTEGIVFMAFDLLETQGRDVRDQSLRERRQVLERVVNEVSAGTSGRIRTSPSIAVRDWAAAERVRADAREAQGAEGIMLKPWASGYHSGRVAGGIAATAGELSTGWWKWKVDPYSVDAVLIYAQQGSGRRAGLFTDYTFGVWDPDASGQLTPFAKAYSGLTNEEIRKVDAFIRANVIDRAGPVRMLKPELVFEISFEAIAESPRHRSGIAVRFPRITRWRTDKTAKEADTIGMVRGLLAAERARDEKRHR